MQSNSFRYSGLVLGALAMGLVSTAVTYFLRSERGRTRVGGSPDTSPDTPSSAPSEADQERADRPVAQTVFVSERGTRYHRGDCRHLRGRRREIPIEAAWENYTPCAICNPLQ